MPLIVITGIPNSGKTTRTLELKEFFESQSKQVHIVSEYEQACKANFDKNDFFSESIKEKHIRGLLKSEVLRLITPHNVVILDGLNYIKGFIYYGQYFLTLSYEGYRYELYCGTKANKSTQCTLHAEINRERAWSFNELRPKSEMYTREVFEALIMRYEEPERKNRWDSPLFLVFPEQELDKKAIHSCLFDKAPPPPNTSTQNAPLSSTNFLYDLDQTTKKIVDSLIKSKNMGLNGVVKIDSFDGLSVDISNVTVQKLMILRRQYITYSKMHAPDPKQIPQLFIQYLNTSLK